MSRRGKGTWLAAAALAGVMGAKMGAKMLRRSSKNELNNKVVLVTGGSRGLGYLLAREFAREGCHLSICARDEAELKQARHDLIKEGTRVLATPCDIADQAQVEQWVRRSLQHFGRIDIVVNNAGVIQVGPMESMALPDYKQAMDIMFWGMLHSTLTVLPHMKERQQGQIINITSIGGKISVPHLLPYSCAKAAAVNLSEGLRAELAGQGISVMTVVPGLMRTGSHLNAHFNGRQQDEFTWFSLGASLPVISMDAERAARQIVKAAKSGKAEVTLSVPAKLASGFYGLFPGLTTQLMGLTSQWVLPSAEGAGTETARGKEVRRELSPGRQRVVNTLTTLGDKAASRYQRHSTESGTTTKPDEKSAER